MFSNNSPPFIDSITVIKSTYNLRLCKTICADGTISDYDRVRTVDIETFPVRDLQAIFRLLHGRLLGAWNSAVVYGAVSPGLNQTQGVRRLAHPDPSTGDAPTLVPVPHIWAALDIDTIKKPESVGYWDIPACAVVAIAALPPEFHGARCIAQATSGHGIKLGQIRLRLWFQLDRPTTGRELGFWLRKYPVDPATFRTAQPIYTSAPIFVGCSDHLPVRLCAIQGAEAVHVPPPADLIPPPRPPAPPPGSIIAASEDDAQAFINGVLARVSAARDGEKHDTLRNSARLLGGIQAEAEFSDAEAVAWLLEALPPVDDVAQAEQTAAWGLEVGRAAPIPVPSRHEQDRPADTLLAALPPGDIGRAPLPLPRDTRASETTTIVLKAITMGVSDAQIIAWAHAHNHRRSHPLPTDRVNEIVAWVHLNTKDSSNGR